MARPAQAALNDPNILLLVSQQLLAIGETQSLARAARVNQLWRHIMLSAVYRSLPKRRLEPPLASLQANAFRVRELTFKEGKDGTNLDVMTQYSLHPTPYTNVVILSLRFLGAAESKLARAIELVRNLPGLKRLTVEDMQPLLNRGTCWDTMLLACPPLETLTLTKVLLGDSATDRVSAMTSLVTVKIYKSQIGQSRNVKPSVMNLTLNQSTLAFSQQLEWASSCPNLTHLQWDSTGTVSTENATIRGILSNQEWPNLSSISLVNNTTPLDDLTVGLMLKASGSRLGTPGARLENVTINGASFWFRSLAALELHFSTLAKLNLCKCENLRGWVSQYIMENCPCLVSFRGAIIDAHDLIDYRWSDLNRIEQEAADTRADDALTTAEEAQGEIAHHAKEIRHLYEANGLHNRGNWICKDLQHLSLALLFPKYEQSLGWDNPALCRVGKLVKLRYLDFWLPDDRRQECRAPDLTLASSGLLALAPLDRLNTFLFQGTNQRMHEDDIKWMSANWTVLKQVSMDLHPDPTQCAELQKLFKKHIAFVEVGEVL